jgi:hypothetical protein
VWGVQRERSQTVNQYKSPFIVNEYSDDDIYYPDLQKNAPRIPLGWFLLIFAVDVAALIGIYLGIAKALR